MHFLLSCKKKLYEEYDMLNVLIMVHNKISETVLRGVFSNNDLFKVVIVPYKNYLATEEFHNKTYSETKEFHIPLMLAAIDANNLKPKNFDYILVESNYSAPSYTTINEELLSYIVNNFLQAKVIAYSGTTESLINALNFNPLIFVLPKDLTFATAVPASLAARIVKISDLKSAGSEARRNSCPFRVELTESTQQDMENLVRFRSNSMPPPVTPLFHMQSQSVPAAQPGPSNASTDTSPDYYKSTSFSPQ